MAVSAVMIIMAATFFYRAMSQQLVSVVDAALEDRSIDLANGIRLGGLDLSDEDRLAQILAFDGTIVASSPSVAPGEVLASTEWFVDISRTDSVAATVENPGSDRKVRSLSIIVETPEGRLLAVVSRPLDAVDDARRRILLGLLIAVPLVLGAIAVVGSVLIRSALRPVRRMAVRASSIEPGRSMIHVDGALGNDEFAALAGAFNELLGRVERSRQHERHFIADVSHELRTPLAIVRGELELARLDADNEIDRALVSSIEEVDRMVALTERLLYAARAEASGTMLDGEPLNVFELVTDLCRKLPTETLGHVNVVTAAVSKDLISIDAGVVTQILINLLDNAARHATTTIEIATFRSGDVWSLTVSDDGPGFPAAMHGLVADRFERGEVEPRHLPQRERFGIGLSIVASLVDAAAGTIEILNGPDGRGGHVTVRLPIDGAET